MNGQREEIAANQVLSAAEGLEIRKRITAAAPAGVQQWRWMGNYGSVYDPVNVANVPPPIGPGGLIININFNNGLVAAWMFY